MPSETEAMREAVKKSVLVRDCISILIAIDLPEMKHYLSTSLQVHLPISVDLEVGTTGVYIC